ncbi:type I-U CRISPR-associated protein Csb2 [Tepidiforma sp.]|uniref:type I-G CRISPR-associated protein Csb2 n=1 Tax=Tepidiforma sp. TaxID=2682230 RepID=UPI002ADD5C4D|nr:type I-U CRISPR-associated protein Csb2 [Tepidiforma sp.]
MLVLCCRLLRDTFEGASPDDPAVAEWPPSWMRVFSALVAVARHSDDAEVALLETLERLPPPAISADPASLAETTELMSERRAWVPTNARKAGSAAGNLPGRSNDARGWARLAPRHLEIWYIWDGEPLGETQFELLQGLCRRVPYLGRSTCPAVLEVARELTGPAPSLLPVPVDAQGVGSVFDAVQSMRVPFPGSLTALRRAYEQKAEGLPGDPWAIGAYVDYRRGEARQASEAVRGPYRTLIVLELQGPTRDGRHVVGFTDLLRRALMANLTRQLDAVHGHGQPGSPRCSFLALPFVGHRHADGHIVGLGVAVPELDRQDLRDLMLALETTVRQGLRSPSLGTFGLRRLLPVDQLRAALTLRSSRWTRPSRWWVTVYPAVLDRFVKRHQDIPELIRLTLRNAGYPEPAAVRSSTRPFSAIVPGAVDLQPHETMRPGHSQGFKPYRHLVLEFAAPVEGPVILGSMRHYGLGLCVPVDEQAAREALYGSAV